MQSTWGLEDSGWLEEYMIIHARLCLEREAFRLQACRLPTIGWLAPLTWLVEANSFNHN
jgi:hypothetical protein